VAACEVEAGAEGGFGVLGMVGAVFEQALSAEDFAFEGRVGGLREGLGVVQLGERALGAAEACEGEAEEDVLLDGEVWGGSGGLAGAVEKVDDALAAALVGDDFSFEETEAEAPRGIAGEEREALLGGGALGDVEVAAEIFGADLIELCGRVEGLRRMAAGEAEQRCQTGQRCACED
jgi:hypothetical protein